MSEGQVTPEQMEELRQLMLESEEAERRLSQAMADAAKRDGGVK